MADEDEKLNQSKKDGDKNKAKFDLYTPYKRAIFGVYQNHAYHFTKERVEKIRRKLQEVYGMSPRETDLEQSNPLENRNRPCRTRFDFLSTPHKRTILDVYQHHAYHFPKERVERIKLKLQELYAMTPEETEKYFDQLKEEANALAKKKMMKIMLRQSFNKQQREKEEKRALKFIFKLMKLAMKHAFYNAVPPLISVRLRNLSDIVLEQICDLRNVDIPDRDNPDQTGQFLIAVADWIAIAIEHVYYGVTLKKYKELSQIELQAKEKEKSAKEKDMPKTVEIKSVVEVAEDEMDLEDFE